MESLFAGNPYISHHLTDFSALRISMTNHPISLKSFAFGRIRRDRTFSVECTPSLDHASIKCDVATRELQIIASAPDQEHTGSGWLSMHLSLLEEEVQFYARYHATRIVAIAVATAGFSVVVESDLPPFLERHAPYLFEDKRSADRLTNLPGDGTLSSPIYRAVCITFHSQNGLDDFLAGGRAMHLPRPLTSNISLREAKVYTQQSTDTVNALLAGLPFALAFEAEKALVNGTLEPVDITSTLSSDLTDLQEKFGDEAASIFRLFQEELGIPSLVERRRRRRQNIQNTTPDLSQRLVETITLYSSARYTAMTPAPPSSSRFHAYHVIVTPCSKILQGPFPGESNSLLRRFGLENQDNFVQVTFQDEYRTKLERRADRDPPVGVDKLLETHYKPLLNNGFILTGRPFKFLGYSMSGLKEHSFMFVTPFVFDGVQLSASVIRSRMGNFSHISHRPAQLAARWSQAFSTSDPSLKLSAAEIEEIPDIISSEGSIFTDGTGTISSELSKTVWAELQRVKKSLSGYRNAPSCFQFRCGGAKGVLVQDPTLVGSKIRLRPSQIKFESVDELRTFDIASTSLHPLPFYLNKPLIALLEFHGVPEQSFLELQRSAIDEVNTARTSPTAASKLFSQHALGDSFRLPSLFSNIHQLFRLLHKHAIRSNEWLSADLLGTSVRFAMACALRDIKYRARLPVPGSFSLIGVADEWACLREGEIFASIKDEKTGLCKTIEGRVLVTRSPQIHPGDIQFATAVRPQELEHLTNVLVFSCEGQRSLPSCLGGGDCDGDIYNIIVDPRLSPPKGYTSRPGSYKSLPHLTTPRPAKTTDVVNHVIGYIKSDIVGLIANRHLRIADIKRADCADCIQLAELASQAVDFPKTGTTPSFQNLPRLPSEVRTKKPDFMAAEGVNVGTDSYYPSQKVLGILYRNVPTATEEENHGEEPNAPGILQVFKPLVDRISLKLGFNGTWVPTTEHKQNVMNMCKLLETYSQRLFVIASTHTHSRRADDHLLEGELLTGTIQGRWNADKKRQDAVLKMNAETLPLVTFVRDELRSSIQADPGLNETSQMLQGNKTFQLAWIALQVADMLSTRGGDRFGSQSFQLIALGVSL